MASKRMLPHSIVVRNYTGEDVSGEAQYLAANLSFVYVETLRKVSRSGVGLNPDDQIRLFVFDAESIVSGEDGTKKTYVNPREWDLMSNAQRESAWTLHDGHDLIDYGGESYKISSIERYDAGPMRMRHWEVYGR